jgi:hypothetical protein
LIELSSNLTYVGYEYTSLVMYEYGHGWFKLPFLIDTDCSI